MAGFMGRARFDFDKHDGAALDRNQVDFANLVAVAAGHDRVAEFLEMPGGGVFPTPAERFFLKKRGKPAHGRDTGLSPGGFFFGDSLALTEANGLADAVAQVVKLGAASDAAALHIDLGDFR
jgi:hypothetical protein